MEPFSDPQPVTAWSKVQFQRWSSMTFLLAINSFPEQCCCLETEPWIHQYHKLNCRRNVTLMTSVPTRSHLCVALPSNNFVSWLDSSSVFLLNTSPLEVSTLFSEVHFSVETSFFMKRSLKDFVLWDTFTELACFFLSAWFFTAVSPILERENVFLHILHLALVLPDSSGSSQSLHSSVLSQSVLNLEVFPLLSFVEDHYLKKRDLGTQNSNPFCYNVHFML